MAQNYEIDIKRFNGQDYDTLLPTPASHASTHQAGGSDPITVKTGNIEDGAVTATKIASGAVQTAKIADGAVTRAKLADDAKYSPIAYMNTSEYSLGTWAAGHTCVPDYSLDSSDINVWLGMVESSQFPIGCEIAVLWSFGNSMTVHAVDGVSFVVQGEGILQNQSLKIADKYAMIALKKIASHETNGDMWLITGNVEVVS